MVTSSQHTTFITQRGRDIKRPLNQQPSNLLKCWKKKHSSSSLQSSHKICPLGCGRCLETAWPESWGQGKKRHPRKDNFISPSTAGGCSWQTSVLVFSFPWAVHGCYYRWENWVTEWWAKLSSFPRARWGIPAWGITPNGKRQSYQGFLGNAIDGRWEVIRLLQGDQSPRRGQACLGKDRPAIRSENYCQVWFYH